MGKAGYALIAILALCAVLNAPAHAANGRHAVLIYDADLKQVISQENGYAKRYPASLTKMMTLYMLFEQMRDGKLGLQTQMTASKLAASQPQTNISLRPGDKITVEQAIKALVVRSANDVAVVVAEHIAGSVPRFADLSTRRARQLGMNNTVFKNPHGLPDNRQYTTAYDMALLGTSLRRDFPQYYHYFTTMNFSYKGRNYASHNRVLNKLPGVDGIKTGYINASGFNLVSSLKRGNINIVAVVMGGTSGWERDQRMVKLLDGTYTRLAAERGGAGATQFAFAPKPVAKPVVALASAKPIQPVIEQKTAAMRPVSQQMAMIPSIDTRIAVAKPVKPEIVVSSKPMPTAKPSFDISFKNDNTPASNSLGINLNLDGIKNATTNQANKAAVIASPKKNTLDYQLATLNQEFPVPAYLSTNKAQVNAGKDWGIQIGVFRDNDAAKQALSEVARKVKGGLNNAIAYVEYAQQENNGFHRARLKNLTKQEAENACAALAKMQQDCFATKIN